MYPWFFIVLKLIIFTMNYFVFEDTVNATQVKIYQETCSHVKNEPTETTKWHEFENFRNENDHAVEDV